MGTKLVWRRNIWTGQDLLELSPTERVARQSYARARPLYSAQYWGDFSLVFPVRGPWRGSLAAPRRDLPALRQSHRGREGDHER